jgi:hypothetical protein
MVTKFKPTTQPLCTPWHRLTRFVTKQAVALLLGVKLQDIDRIERWTRVLLVVGPHISRFVSYADLPPIPNVAPPTVKDYLYWRRRWGKIAPKFWAEFYAGQFAEASNLEELFNWGQIATIAAQDMPLEQAQWLQSKYNREQFCREYF